MPGDINTSWGITQPVYDLWRSSKHLTLRNVDEGTPLEFEAVYRSEFWEAAKCDVLPIPLDLLHFDSAVNHGVPTANKILQTALGLSQVDGVIGPQTLKAVKQTNTRVLFGRYCNLRISRYIVLTTLESRHLDTLGGWLRRVGMLLQVA